MRPLLKRHRSLSKDLRALEKELEADTSLGSSLGHGLYKVRLAISSKGKGKSGGARVITYTITEDREISCSASTTRPTTTPWISKP